MKLEDIKKGYYVIQSDLRKALGTVTKCFEWTYFEWEGTENTDPVAHRGGTGMKTLGETKHFQICTPNKAARGLTSSVQVRMGGVIMRQFRFQVKHGFQDALQKDWGWAVEHELRIAEGLE